MNTPKWNKAELDEIENLWVYLQGVFRTSSNGLDPGSAIEAGGGRLLKW